MTAALSEREREILRILAEDSGVSVSMISEQLKVSAVTIRSDLNRLAERGLVVRTRGGAFPAFHPSILERQKRNMQAKTAIAKTAADLIEDGDHVMISAGTTTALIPKFLLGKQEIHIVTNSTLIVPYARINPALHVTFVGGEFRASAEAMVGAIALREVERFHVKTAFIGTDGFSLETGVTANLVELAEVVKTMTAHAEQRVVVADSDKYGNAGFARIGPLTDMSAIVTDDNLDKKIVSELEENGLSITTVEA